MGILGLTTFISKYSLHMFENFSLHDCSLVIDGNSLAVQIYQKCNSLFGGDYDEYSKAVRKFFTNLEKCRIIPFVVCDGGYEDKKLKTVQKRLRCRIIDASRLNPANQSASLVFPLLLKDVFVQVLISLKVKYTFCEYEADHEIAALARYLQCPVLSYDSDFFIYNVSYIPFPSLTLKPCPKKQGQVSQYVLKCKLFRVENFIKFFEGFQPDVLPLMATLLGNDYIKRNIFSKFYHNLKQSKFKKRTQGQCRISGLIEWLKNETYESALEKVLNRFKLSERNRIQRAIHESCTNYKRTYCNLLYDLDIDIPQNCEREDQKVSINNPSLEEVIDQEDEIDSSCGSSVSSSDDKSSEEELENFIEYTNMEEHKPICRSWVLSLLKKGRISPRFFDLLHKCLYIATPQVEDFKLPDSNLSSLPILKFNFNIISGFKVSQFYYQGRKNLTTKITTIDCSEFLSDSSYLNLVYEDKIPNHKLFYRYFEQSLQSSQIESIKLFPPNLQMIILTILWMKNYNGGINMVLSESHIYSLILCHLTLSVIKNKIGCDYMHFEFNSKFSSYLKTLSIKQYESSNDDFVNISELNENKIIYEDCMVAASFLLKYFEVESKLYSSVKLYKQEYLHGFAQFQCILQQISYLNVLTSEPLINCEISNSYNGTFIYNMFSNLKRRSDPGSYIYQLLRSSPTVLKYVMTVAKFLGCKDCRPLASSTSEKRPKIKRKRNTKNIPDSAVIEVKIDDVSDDTGTHDINNRFYMLNFETR